MFRAGVAEHSFLDSQNRKKVKEICCAHSKLELNAIPCLDVQEPCESLTGEKRGMAGTPVGEGEIQGGSNSRRAGTPVGGSLTVKWRAEIQWEKR